MLPEYNTNRRGYEGYTNNSNNFEDFKSHDRRHIIAKITPSVLEKLFSSKGDLRLRTNLPKDVKIIRMDWNYEQNTFDVTLESKHFEVQQEGGLAPIVWNPIIIEDEKDYIDRKVKKLKE